MLFSQFNWVDYVIFGVIFLSIIFCYRKGFVGSTLSIVCWLLALIGSFKLASPVGNVFQHSIQSDYIRTILGFFIIFIIFALISVLIIYLFNHLIEKAVLHKTDKVIGGFSGIVVGIFIVAGLLLVARYSALPAHPFWTHSYMIPYFHPFEEVINDILPVSVQAERDFLPEDSGLHKSLKQASDKIEESVDDVKEKMEKTKNAGKSIKESSENIKDKMGDVIE